MNIDMTLPFHIIVLLMFGGMLVLWIIGLIDCIQHETAGDKPLWLALLIIGGGIVALIYWFWRRPYREQERFQARLNAPSTELANAISRMREPPEK